jgi:serine/threonine protein kinase
MPIKSIKKKVVIKKNNKKKKRKTKRTKRKTLKNKKGGNPSTNIPKPDVAAGLYTQQFKGPWGNINVTPTTTEYINNNLLSANPPPGATTQYPGTIRQGNNYDTYVGVNDYVGTAKNSGPFTIKTTSKAGGKKKKKKKSPKRKKYSKKQIGGAKCSYEELKDLAQKVDKKNDSLIKDIYVNEENGNEYVKYNEYLCGKGTFKHVWAGFDTQNNSLIAWNEVELPNGLIEKKRLANEIALLSNLDHPNIIKLKDSWKNPPKYILITEIFNNTTLDKYYKKYIKESPHSFKQNLKTHIIQILDVIKYLHERNIIHRDIKPENIGINNDDIKIMDFGLSTEFLPEPTTELLNKPLLSRAHSLTNVEDFTMMGTPLYMAPEMFENKYNKTVDIYAFGHTMLELILDTQPYKHLTGDITSAITIVIKVHEQQKPIYKLYTEGNSLNEILSLEYKKYIDPKNDARNTSLKIQKFLQDNYPKEKEIIDISISNNRLSAEALINIYTGKKKYSDYDELLASTQQDFLKEDEKNNPQKTPEYRTADDIFALPSPSKFGDPEYETADHLLAPPDPEPALKQYETADHILAPPDPEAAVAEKQDPFQHANLDDIFKSGGGKKKKKRAKRAKRKTLKNKKGGNPPAGILKPDVAAGLYTQEFKGPWGNINVTPTTTEYINKNLLSANPPPGATTQYPGTIRQGNNYDTYVGVNDYVGTAKNSGPFTIKCTSKAGGKKKKKIQKEKNERW